MENRVNDLKSQEKQVQLADQTLATQRLKDAEREVAQLTFVVTQLLERHHDAMPLPPESLRLHVGTKTTISNFLSQGANSSRKILKLFGLDPKGPVLDWGCGSGRTLRWLWEYPAWREYYRGCDVDGEAVTWLSKQGIACVQVCDSEPPLPYPDNYFAGVFAFSVLTHIHPLKHHEWYLELRRILRPGASAYLTTQGTALSNRLPDVARAEFVRSGFAYVEHEGHYKDAALVSEAFTRNALQGQLELIEYVPSGYQNMDAFQVIRP